MMMSRRRRPAAGPGGLRRTAAGLVLVVTTLAFWDARAANPQTDPAGNGRGAPTANAALQPQGPRVQQPDLPPLKAAPGMTALAGRIVDLAGRGLPGVTVASNSERTLTDATGRWVLAPVTVGPSVLRIDGRKAGAKRNQDFGVYEIRTVAEAGRTTVLPFVSWLAPIDHANDVTIASPTTTETVIRTAAIPDLELRLPVGTIVRDIDGKPVTRIGITPVPFDRLPLPVPQNFQLPVFFTIQPGASCFDTVAGEPAAATLRYPNWGQELPRARATFWRYEPDANGWAPHGTGTISADGRQLVPDPGVTIADWGSAECSSMTRSRMDPPVFQDVRRQARDRLPAARP